MSGPWEVLGVREAKDAIDRVMLRAETAVQGFIVEGGHVIERIAKEHAGEGGRHKKGTPTPATRITVTP